MYYVVNECYVLCCCCFASADDVQMLRSKIYTLFSINWKLLRLYENNIQKWWLLLTSCLFGNRFVCHHGRIIIQYHTNGIA